MESTPLFLLECELLLEVSLDSGADPCYSRLLTRFAIQWMSSVIYLLTCSSRRAWCTTMDFDMPLEPRLRWPAWEYAPLSLPAELVSGQPTNRPGRPGMGN